MEWQHADVTPSNALMHDAIRKLFATSQYDASYGIATDIANSSFEVFLPIGTLHGGYYVKFKAVETGKYDGT